MATKGGQGSTVGLSLVPTESETEGDTVEAPTKSRATAEPSKQQVIALIKRVAKAMALTIEGKTEQATKETKAIVKEIAKL